MLFVLDGEPVLDEAASGSSSDSPATPWRITRKESKPRAAFITNCRKKFENI